MTKKNIMPVVVLTAICVVVAALLGAVNVLTAPVIEEAEAQKVYDSFRSVLDGVYSDADMPENAANSVTAMYKVTDSDGKLLGHVATVTVKGYANNISVTVGVDAEGKGTKAEVTASAETHGKAGMKTYTDNFAGLDAAGVAGVDTFSGATISSTAIRGAILDAVNAITGVKSDDTAETLPKTDDEIIALGKELIGSDVELTDVTPEKTDLVKRMYKASSGKGYVAYVIAISPNYGTVETETLIHINNNGKIVNVNKLLWKTSDAMYGYVPPTEDVVNEFYGRLPGNGSGNIGDVDLVTNATSTSTRLMDGIKEALTIAEELIKKDMPTAEDEVKKLAKELIGADVELADVTPDDGELVKKIYKAGTNKGYVAYVVVISPNYGTVETETLIHIDNAGKIVKVNKLLWKTSDAIYGYVPPTEDVVNEFYGRLPGNGSGSIGDVDLVTNATSTSTRLMDGIKEALAATEKLIRNDMPTAEDEVKRLAKELIGADVELTDLTPDGTEYLRRLYKAGSGKGYVAYVVAISPNYGTVETETLIHIDNDGRIVKINKLLWKTSDAIYGYVPPTEEEVNAFYDRLVGKGSAGIESVELVTNATNTATRLMAGIGEALGAADTLAAEEAAGNYTPRIIGIVILALGIACPTAICVYNYVKRRKRA